MGFRYLGRPRLFAEPIGIAGGVSSYSQYVLSLIDSASAGIYLPLNESGSVTVADNNAYTAQPGSELVSNGGFDSATTGWTPGNSATLASVAGGISGNALQITENGANNPFALQALVAAIGDTYTLRAYMKQGTSSAGRFYWSNSSNQGYVSNQTLTDSWVLYEFSRRAVVTNPSVVVANVASAASGLTALFDTVSVMKTGQGDGTYSNVTLASTTWGNGQNAPLFVPASNSIVNLYSTWLANNFNGAEGTIMLRYKVRASSVLADSTVRYMVRLAADSNNQVYIARAAANNTFAFVYVAGGTSEVIAVVNGSDTENVVGITWSKSNDRVRAYVNGVQSGSDSTSLGTWTGSLSSTLSLMGALTTSGSNVFDGYAGDLFWMAREATPTEMGRLYNLSPA